MQTNIILSLADRITLIPYSGTDRKDAPHDGFKLLKGRPDAVETIPATKDSAALRHALAKVNDSATPFFTVACRMSTNNLPESCWVRGYLEFSFNYLDIAKDSPNYYLLFEQFNRYVREAGFDLPVDFNFELQKANYAELPADGHTACVWITTAEFPTMDGARMVWNQSVGLLADFLGNFENPSLPAIYQG
jgi:hypothetical protein